MNSKLFLIIAINCLWGLHAMAQNSELRPLAEYIQLPQDRKEEAYPFIRCVGLFRGIFRYGGANFSAEEADQVQANNAAMIFVAFKYRTNKHPDFSEDDIVVQIGSEIDSIELMYSNRMQQNFARTGEAWGADETIQSDLGICGRISEMALKAVSQ